MNPNGRPKTRSLETQMIAIYRIVTQAMINNETENVSKACRAVFEKHSFIKFTDPSLPEFKRLTDICKTPENLRKRYYRAIECASNEIDYPILSATVDKMQKSLANEINRHKYWRESFEQIRNDGHHPSGEY